MQDDEQKDYDSEQGKSPLILDNDNNYNYNYIFIY